MDHAALLKKWLRQAVEENASDVLISVGHPPVLRITGDLAPLAGEKTIAAADSQAIAEALLGERSRGMLADRKEVDFSYETDGGVRFRVNIFYQRGSLSIAMRLIPRAIGTIEDLSLPPILHEFTRKTQGLVLVAGASGQGKSTTLASMIDEINHTRACHIITIEDPIEYVYESVKAVIDQREVLTDTESFAAGLRAVFRQNPDVIMVGEMRDLETIATAVTAAETGHLVLATLHTNSASQSIHRIIDAFPSEQQNQIRFQLASSLLAAVSQRLVPAIKGGFIPACEVMIGNTAIGNLIRENKIHEMPAVIETSSKEGMISFDRALEHLVAAKEISPKTALAYANNSKSFL